jgi:hypothetical protein
MPRTTVRRFHSLNPPGYYRFGQHGDVQVLDTDPTEGIRARCMPLYLAPPSRDYRFALYPSNPLELSLNNAESLPFATCF